MNVDVAKEGELLERGMVRISPAGKVFMGVYRQENMIYTTLHLVSYLSALWKEREYERYNPSIDYMFDCLACICPQQTVGVILTGMGSDGVVGLSHLRKNGGYTLCQDQEFCCLWNAQKSLGRRRNYERGFIRKYDQRNTQWCFYIARQSRFRCLCRHENVFDCLRKVIENKRSRCVSTSYFISPASYFTFVLLLHFNLSVVLI